MLKGDYLKKHYQQRSEYNNLRLYTKCNKEGIIIVLLVGDPAAKNLLNHQIDFLSQAFQTRINLLDKEYQRILRICRGHSKLSEQLKDLSKWQYQADKNILTIKIQNTILNCELQLVNFLNVLTISQVKQLLHSEESKKLLPEECNFLIGKLQQDWKINNQLVLRAKQKRSLIPQKKHRLNHKYGQKNSDLNQSQLSSIKQEQQDALKASKLSAYPNYISYQSSRKSFRFQDTKVTKIGNNQQRYILGKDDTKYLPSFTIKIEKLNKKTNNHMLWVGVASISEDNKTTNLIALSDRKRVFKTTNFIHSVDNSLNYPEGKLYYKDTENNFLKKQINQKDIVTITVDNKDGTITWVDGLRQEYASCQWEMLNNNNLRWVPYVQLCQMGDSINWMKEKLITSGPNK